VFRTIGLLISLPCVALSVLPAYAQDRSVALVLDASGSMKAALPDRTTRMDAARTAVARLVATLDRRTRLALRIYGDQWPTATTDCKDRTCRACFKAFVIARHLTALTHPFLYVARTRLGNVTSSRL
jgi:uncharacterized protein (DUF58 family)